MTSTLHRGGRALCSGLLLSVSIASSAPAVVIDWTFVGNPGNAADTEVMTTDGTTGYGSVGYAYNIGTFEVTNAQYAEFLNAKAASDPLQLYSGAMALFYGGITRDGVDGSYTYSAVAGREGAPVNYVSFYDAARFANWMNNGQGNGDTETGTYTLLGGTETPSNGGTVTRNPGATIFLASEDEWYKAAYYDPGATSYFDYPTGSNATVACSTPTSAPNFANCGYVYGYGGTTIAGSYTGTRSPYGAYDQAGNVSEWTEAILDGSGRITRGGGFLSNPGQIAAAGRYGSLRAYMGGDDLGFRLTSVPEPRTGALFLTGLAALAARRRRT